MIIGWDKIYEDIVKGIEEIQKTILFNDIWNNKKDFIKKNPKDIEKIVKDTIEIEYEYVVEYRGRYWFINENVQEDIINELKDKI